MQLALQDIGQLTDIDSPGLDACFSAGPWRQQSRQPYATQGWRARASPGSQSRYRGHAAQLADAAERRAGAQEALEPLRHHAFRSLTAWMPQPCRWSSGGWGQA